MGMYRKIVAHCDQKDKYNSDSSCFSAQTLNPDTTQPYRDLIELGWTVGEDGVTLSCPKHKEG